MTATAVSISITSVLVLLNSLSLAHAQRYSHKPSHLILIFIYKTTKYDRPSLLQVDQSTF